MLTPEDALAVLRPGVERAAQNRGLPKPTVSLQGRELLIRVGEAVKTFSIPAVNTEFSIPLIEWLDSLEPDHV